METPTTEENPVDTLREALLDLALGRVRRIEDVLNDAKKELLES